MTRLDTTILLAGFGIFLLALLMLYLFF